MKNRIAQRQHTVKSQNGGSDEPALLSQRTAEGDVFSAFVVQVFRLNGLLLSEGDALAESAGQTSARWRILAAVEDAPMPVAQIARTWGLARQSVQRVANVLVRERLAEYQVNPTHRRAQLLVITPRGSAALQAIQSSQREWANRLGAEIGEADLLQASALLSRVERIFKE